MRHISFASSTVSLGSYYFTKVRYAGRFEHTKTQGAPSAG